MHLYRHNQFSGFPLEVPEAMAVTNERNIDDALRARLLELYREAFEPLRTLTATKQTLATDEFSAVLDFDATQVFVSRNRDGEVTGFTVGIDDLKLIPWINPEYFYDRFPEHYATGRLIYVPCFVVDPAHQKGVTLLRLAGAISSFYGGYSCVLAMDCCQHNVDIEHFPSILQRAASRYTPTTLHELDRQTFWAFELGEG